MFKDIPSKSRTLRGISDLTLVAPVRRGLVFDTPDARSYETRLTLLLRSLNTLRYASIEVNPAPAIPDVVDRIRTIHSFRLALLDGPGSTRMLLLSVAFDGGWELYMRRIWRDLGPLLDLIFCNCDGYPPSHCTPYAAYANWVRKAQLNTGYFYAASPVTVSDLHWLRERQRSVPSSPPQPTAAELVAQALPALSALYRLTDLYAPNTEDGKILLRAARQLLAPLWQAMAVNEPLLLPENVACRTPTERAAVAWFASSTATDEPADNTAADGSTASGRNDANTQVGIVQRLTPQPTHGALLLIALDDATAVAALIEHMRPKTLSAQAQKESSDAWFNLFFTRQGLQLAGVPEGHLACLPPEFLEGMEARAAVLGDLEGNHPQHWTLPERNGPQGSPGPIPERVPLSAVHAVVQILVADTRGQPGWRAWDASHPVDAHIKRRLGAKPLKGVRILSVQPMHRNHTGGDEQAAREHFGFADGLSNPELPVGDPTQRPDWDHWALGDYLLGYPNSHGDPPQQGRFWTDSSFLVVRKLKQDVAALERVLGEPSATSNAAALLIGRRQNGANLVDGKIDNAFDYMGDPEGTKCPLHAHVRRANPRVPSRQRGDLSPAKPGERDDLRVLPRIIRRGMSYGPPVQAPPLGAQANDDEDRGVMFMAYNASIAEQFELIQAWLAGGNSGGKGAYSGQRDPLFAVPRPGDPDHFGFVGPGSPSPVCLPAKPPITLQWGLYLFVPSIAALEDMVCFAKAQRCPAVAATPPDPAAAQRAIEAKKGAMVIAKLQAMEASLGVAAAREQWKAVLEDVVGERQAGLGQCVWTAIRDLHGGALRTPYGVLVGSRDRVMEVFDNRMDRYTVSGYRPRMAASFGSIYLGLDDGPKSDAAQSQTDYQAQSTVANDAISAITRQDGFGIAFNVTKNKLEHWRGKAPAEGFSFDVKDLVDEVLAPICTHFFGLPDAGGSMRSGAWQAQVGEQHPEQPSCPGHFHAPSRYTFQPNPGDAAAAMGQRHGKALRAYVDDRLKAGFRKNNTSAIGKKLQRITNDAQYASTLIGIMMGFLPTVDGNLRGALYEWVDDRSLWDLQLIWQNGKGRGLQRAEDVIKPRLCRAMQLRAVPELVWRTATRGHSLGSVDVAPGERIVVGIVSAMQQNLLEGSADLDPVFGGDRRHPPHPTHACPGYGMAMGVMLGVLAALLTMELRPSLSAQLLRLMPTRHPADDFHA